MNTDSQEKLSILGRLQGCITFGADFCLAVPVLFALWIFSLLSRPRP